MAKNLHAYASEYTNGWESDLIVKQPSGRVIFQWYYLVLQIQFGKFSCLKTETDNDNNNDVIILSGLDCRQSRIIRYLETTMEVPAIFGRLKTRLFTKDPLHSPRLLSIEVGYMTKRKLLQSESWFHISICTHRPFRKIAPQLSFNQFPLNFFNDMMQPLNF